MNGLQPPFSNPTPAGRVMEGMKIPFTRAARGGKLGKLLFYAPIAIEVLTLLRGAQKKKGKYTRARKRDRAVDFMLGQAQKRLKTPPTRKRGWF